MSSREELVKMILQFKITHLQLLLAFAGQNKNGRKNELQEKALRLISNKPSIPLAMKIKHLYNKLMFENNPEHYREDHYMNNYFMNTVPNQASQSIQYNNNNNNYHSARNYYNSDSTENTYRDACSFKNPVYPSYSSHNSLEPPALSASDFNYLNYLNPSIKIPYSEKLNNIYFKKLPFYNYKSNVIPVTALIPETRENDLFEFIFHSFTVDPQQHSQLNWYKRNDKESRYQIQLRMCLLSNAISDSNEQIEVTDSLPLSLLVKVNDRVCQLPPAIPSTNKNGVLLKRMNAPINITPQISKKNTVNTIVINWSVECDKLYGISVHFVEKYTSDELIEKLNKKGERDAECTKKYISDKLNELGDDDIAATSLKVSLICPLGKIIMSLPVRATSCNHLQCFDGSLYIRMNEVKSVWQCPVCNQPCLYEDLFVDGFFTNILKNDELLSKGTEIQVNCDGSVIPVTLKRPNGENVDANHAKKRRKIKPAVKPDSLHVPASDDSNLPRSLSGSEKSVSDSAFSFSPCNESVDSASPLNDPLRNNDNDTIFDSTTAAGNDADAYSNSFRNQGETFFNAPKNEDDTVFNSIRNNDDLTLKTLRSNCDLLFNSTSNDSDPLFYATRNDEVLYNLTTRNDVSSPKTKENTKISATSSNSECKKGVELIDLTASDSETEDPDGTALNLKTIAESSRPPIYDVDDSDS